MMEFATELAQFHETIGDFKCCGLIILGTRQSTTAALLVGALKPERVAFLLTDETRSMPQQVADQLHCSDALWFCPEGNYNETLAVYEGVKAVMKRWSDLEPAQIVVDVTGGLKPMAVGLEKAAHFLGLRTVYIASEYERRPDGGSAPKPGSQRLVIPPDPYDVFGDLEDAEAKRLYAAHDYSGASRIFARLAQRASLPLAERYARCEKLAAIYAAWDVFDLVAAHAKLVAVLPTLDGNQPDYATLQQQAAALHTLITVARHAAGRDDQAIKTLADADKVLPLLGSLFMNARRRQMQGRLDTAALLLYRCLELISQHRLANWGILSEQPTFREIVRRMPDLASRYRAIQKAQGRTSPRPLPDRAFGLFVGYMLLAALDDQLVRGYDIAEIEQRTNARNRSILAHGYALITDVEYAPFAAVVDAILDLLFKTLDRSRSEWEKTYRFIDLVSLS